MLATGQTATMEAAHPLPAAPRETNIMSLPGDYELDRPPRAIPAWGMSLGLHLVIILAVSLLVIPESTPKGAAEVDRQASIVLVQAHANSEKRYLTEADAAEQSELAPSEAAEEPASSAAGGSPESSAQAELAELLPQRSNAPGASATVETALPLSQFRGPGKHIPTDGKAEAEIVASEREMYRSREPVGPTAKVSVFGSAAAEGRSFTFVIDRSASTGSDGLDVLDVAAKQLALAVEYLEPTHRFQIVAYNQKPHYLGPKQMTPATPENKKLVAKFFQTLNPYGSTDHALALRAAVGAKPDVVFLMTDGGDPFLTAGQYAEIVALARGQTSIHCIQFGHGPALAEGESFMKKLSGATGGSYTYVDVTK